MRTSPRMTCREMRTKVGDILLARFIRWRTLDQGVPKSLVFQFDVLTNQISGDPVRKIY